jgi:hypothetical protein
MYIVYYFAAFLKLFLNRDFFFQDCEPNPLCFYLVTSTHERCNAVKSSSGSSEEHGGEEKEQEPLGFDNLNKTIIYLFIFFSFVRIDK